MTDSTMSLAVEPRAKKAARKQGSGWLIAAGFIVISLAWGVYSAPRLAIEPLPGPVLAVLQANLLAAFIHLGVILAAYLVTCMVAKQDVAPLPLLAVGFFAFASPLAAPFAVDAAGAAAFPEERAVLAALDADLNRGVAEHRKAMFAADLEDLILPEIFSQKDFKAYDARVASYRDAANALNELATTRDTALKTRLAKSAISPENQTRMLSAAKAQTAAQADRNQELHDLRLRAADNAGAAMAMLKARPKAWRMWYGQLAFDDPQMKADFNGKISAARQALFNLGRLEGTLAPIGAAAQKRAT